MAREFVFQDPGEGIHEAEVTEVHVSVGDEVEEGQTILTVETDKAVTELPSPFSGSVESIPVEEGQVVEVGAILMAFADEGDGAGDEREASAEREQSEHEEREEEEPREREQPGHEERRTGSRHGEDGRGRQDGRGGETPVPASPATRRLARELGVDLRAVEPGGAHGRVTLEDVRAAAEGGERRHAEAETGEPPREKQAAQPANRALVVEAPPLPDFERWGPIERVPLRGLRRTIATRMAVSAQQVAQVTHHDLADVTELERFRRAHADQVASADGDQLSLMVLVMKALVGLLQRHPRFNASLDAEAGELVLKRHYHLGVAVDTEDGLIVPVVRDADRHTIADLAAEVQRLVERARARELAHEELEGSTFTVTNVGPLGGRAFTPLVNHPEVAILGMARAHLEPVAQGDLDDHRIEVRLLLPLSLSFDHRVVNGADAARFVSELVAALAEPESLLLSV